MASHKRALFKRAAQLKCPVTLKKAKDLQRSMKATIQVAHDDYARKIALKAKEDLKLFWSYIKRFQSTSPKPCFMENAVPVTEPSSIARLFASQFSSTYSSTTSLDPDLLAQEVETRVTTPAASISTISFSHDDLHEAVRFIKPSQNPGPDYIAPSFLKLIYPHVSYSLLLMFQSFMDNAFVPQKWKESFVTPVHKGRGKPTCEMSSYRPVSITSILCRTFERLVNRSIIAFLEQNRILASSQHVFRPNRSCETALATVAHYVSSNMDSGTPTDLIQLDLTNAFDTLDHAILVTKAAQAGLQGTLLLWLARFVVGRSQRVHYHGSHSESYLALSGVPQGSVLGPTLFSLYVNDMPQSNDVLLVQYADDTSILAPVSSCDNSSVHLQDYLTHVSQWASVNHLSISETKSVVLRFHNSKRATSPVYTLEGYVLRNVFSAAILGVTFTPTLDFSLHVSNAVAKARRTLGFVVRTSKPCCPDAFRALYTALVLPRLEYCSSVWNPFQVHLTNMMESVQHRATRTLFTRLGCSREALPRYEARPQRLGWQTLQQRRTVARIGFLCRCLDGSLDDSYISSVVRYSKRTVQPEPMYARTVRHHNSLIPAAARDFLSAPRHVRTPLPSDRASSRELCRTVARSLRDRA
ncbi:hypothetical protein HPB49_026145 [Dermacentor silvarum]|nr:hypothetical protein HPB49_026145 [Dermacentor silvarum]